MIGLFASSVTAFLVAKTGTKKSYQPFEEKQDSNSELKLNIPKTIDETYFDTNICRFCLAGLPLVAIFDFPMVITQPFKELKVEIWNSSLLSPNLSLGPILKPL